MFKFVQDAQKSNATKMVIKYDGKWKYVIPSPEALIQLDIIISHLCSGSSVNNGTFEKGMKEAFEIAKKDKLIICVRQSISSPTKRLGHTGSGIICFSIFYKVR